MRKLFLAVILFTSISLIATYMNDVTLGKTTVHSTSSILGNTVIDFSLDEFKIEEVIKNNQHYKKISLINEGLLLEIGKPQLPTVSRLIAIPAEGEVELIVNYSNQEIISDVTIFPQQKLQDESEARTNEFTIDEEFYEKGEIFPKQIVTMEAPVIMRDIRLVRVTFNPFQYNAKTDELIINSQIEISVKTSGSGGDNVLVRNSKRSKVFDKIYSSSILNYDALNSRDDFQLPSLLIIYPNNSVVEGIVQELSDWKHRKGFVVRMANTSETGTNKADIKNYIQDLYDNSENPPEYVCFIGDASGSYSVQTWTDIWSGFNGEGDHPYSQLAGDDILADVVLGRISISSTTELQTIINKIFFYEKEPYMDDTDWFQKSVLIGDPGSSGISCVYTNQHIAEIIERNFPEFDNNEIYSGSWANLMSTALNGGVSYFNYRGYYGMSGWANSNISALNNGPMLPFAVFLTCATGSFASGTSRSEEFLRVGTPSIPKGAIAAIGTATSHTHTTFNNCVDMGIFYGIFQEGLSDPGSALIRGKLNLFNNFPNNPANAVNIFSHWNTLIGDPSVRLWTGIPQELDVTYDTSVALGSNYYSVNVSDLEGNPVEDAWVVLLKGDDEIFELAYSDENGDVNFEIEANNVGSAKLTVTGQDCIPFLADLVFEEADLNIQVNSFVIDDDDEGFSSGNGDGLPNVGETIQLEIELQNFGTTMANNVDLTISSESEFVEFDTSFANFGNIDANSSVTSDDCVLTIADNCLGGKEIVLDLLIFSNGEEWSDQISIYVSNAIFYANTIETIDGEIFNPGQTAEFTIDLENIGTVTALNVQTTISCESEYLSFDDAEANYGTIVAGDEITNISDTYTISASTQVLPGTEIPLIVDITADNNFHQTETIVLVVGEKDVGDPVGPDSYGYYLYDSFDMDYAIAPMYDWMDVSTVGTNLNLYDNGENGDISTISLPFDLQFYGFTYEELTICSNGWASPGVTDQESFMNWHVPGAMGPSPMIAPFWDDLKTSDGNVYYYYDITNHRFIVHWKNMRNSYDNSLENFQLIIRDSDYYPTTTGDCELVFQYETVNNIDQGSYGGSYVLHGEYATVGIEDFSSTVGLEYTYSNNYALGAHQLVNNMAILVTTNGGEVSDPPIVNFSADSFDLIIPPGEIDQRVLNVSNSGEGNLYFSINKDYVEGRDAGGPDNYGYCWEDSNEEDGPVFSWRDISEIATELTFTGNDDANGIFDIGFDFNFYGTEYSQFIVNPNGWIGFADDYNEWLNIALPADDAPQAALMPFWDDLYPTIGANGEGTVYYYSTPDSLIVTFDDVQHYPGQNNGNYTFQTIIYPNGEFVFQYAELSGDINRCTIGIQNEDSSDATNVVYNSNYLEENLAIAFRHVINWCEIDNNSGIVQSGESVNITIDITAAELPLGSYLCNLNINTNDPDVGNVVIPINLTVAGDVPILSVDSDLLYFGILELDESIEQTLIISNIGSEILDIFNIESSSDAYSVDFVSCSLAENENCEALITFSPTQFDENLGQLTIFSNDFINPEYVVLLTGIGASANIYVSTQEIEFETIFVDETTFQTFTISNNGTGILEYNISNEFNIFSVESDEGSIAANESEEITITFAPTSVGSFSDVITILSNDPEDEIVEIDIMGNAELQVSNEEEIPLFTEVKQNYPNPFGAMMIGRDFGTKIDFSIADNSSFVKLSVYNIKGQLVKVLIDEKCSIGNYSVYWNGKDKANNIVGSGIYYYKFNTDSKESIKKMLLIK